MDTLSPVTYLQLAPTHEKSSTPMQRPKLRACSWRAMNKGTESLIHMGLGGTRNLCPAGGVQEWFGDLGLRGFWRFGVTNQPIHDDLFHNTEASASINK